MSRIEPGTDEQTVETAYRYLSGAAAEGYLDFARKNFGENVAIYLRPELWLSSDIGSF